MTIYGNADTYRHITPDQLKACIPKCPKPVAWARAFDAAIERFEIDDVAMLLAQVGHESADLTTLEENLHYSALRLQEVWPSRFPDLASTKGYARNPEALANKVYGSRLGNRNAGDGWLRRGSGPIQLTGAYNQRRFSNAINDPKPYDDPALLREPKYGALSACWYYSEHVPEGADIITVTKRVNGGRHGLADRKARYKRCREALA